MPSTFIFWILKKNYQYGSICCIKNFEADNSWNFKCDHTWNTRYADFKYKVLSTKFYLPPLQRPFLITFSLAQKEPRYLFFFRGSCISSDNKYNLTERYHFSHTIRSSDLCIESSHRKALCRTFLFFRVETFKVCIFDMLSILQFYAIQNS